MVDISNLSQLFGPNPNGFLLGAESGNAAFPSLYPTNSITNFTNVKWFGAKGDGVTDDTAAFVAAVASLNKSRSALLIPPGVYMVSARPLYFLDMSNFVVEGYGATIKYMNGITPSDATRLIEARRCTNFTINGLVLDGNRANRPSVLEGFLFSIQKCINFTLNNVGAINGTIDGYYIAGEPGQSADPTYYSENFLINNCYADNNARQGMSIINANDYTITGGYFSRTNGSSPQAGIDVEANAPFPASLPSNARGRFYGVMFESNNGFGLLISSKGSPEDFIVEGCQFIGNQEGGVYIGSNNTWVRNCVFRSNNSSISYQGILQTVRDSTITNGGFIGNKFVGSTFTYSSPTKTGSFEIFTGEQTSNFIVDGNRSEGAPSYGIVARGPSIIIKNNTIINALNTGITNQSTDCIIADNKMIGCAGRGIYSTTDNTRIINNVIEDCTGATPIYIDVASGDNVIIAENIMRATTLQAAAKGVAVAAGNSLILRNNISSNLSTTTAYDINAIVDILFKNANIGAPENGTTTLKNNTGIYARNAGNTASYLAANLDASDLWTFGSITAAGSYTNLAGGTGGVFQLVNGTRITQAGTTYFRPGSDNAYDLGTGSVRWKAVYAVNGTIQTSDERSKCEIRLLSQKEKSVAVKLKTKLQAFKFKDAVEEKGEKARWHFGIIAQDVAKAFADEGLDAHQYGMFCYDEWDGEAAVLDEDGNIIHPAIEAGNRYGIRYDELLAFIISAM